MQRAISICAVSILWIIFYKKGYLFWVLERTKQKNKQNGWIPAIVEDTFPCYLEVWQMKDDVKKEANQSTQQMDWSDPPQYQTLTSHS